MAVPIPSSLGYNTARKQDFCSKCGVPVKDLWWHEMSDCPCCVWFEATEAIETDFKKHFDEDINIRAGNSAPLGKSAIAMIYVAEEMSCLNACEAEELSEWLHNFYEAHKYE